MPKTKLKTMARVRRRTQSIKRPTILSYGLLEHAANACGFSFAGMMSEKEQLKAARGLRHLRKPAPPNDQGQRRRDPEMNS